MRTLTESERYQIWIAKHNWKQHNRKRKLFSCYDLRDIGKLAELSNSVNATY